MPVNSVPQRLPGARRAWRRIKNDLTYWPARGALALLSRLPLPLAVGLADWAGGIVYALLPSLRRLSEEHLRLAFGDRLDKVERRRIARRAVKNAARSFAEVAKFDAIAADLDDYFDVAGSETARLVLSTGASAIVVTAHLGNWELLAAYFGRKGIPISAVARRVYDERLNSLLVGFRARHGVQTIMREDRSAARQILHTLKTGRVLAMLVDQDTHAPSLAVPFFGRPARSPMAPAMLSLRCNVPLLAAFIERRPGGGHRITIQPPFSIAATGDRLADIRRLLLAINRAIEAEVRRRPEDWVWWHRRWRRKSIPGLDPPEEVPYAPTDG